MAYVAKVTKPTYLLKNSCSFHGSNKVVQEGAAGQMMMFTLLFRMGREVALAMFLNVGVVSPKMSSPQLARSPFAK